MKPHSFKKVKYEEIAHLNEPIKTISRLNNWQIFALALPAEPATIIYIVASLPLAPRKCEKKCPKCKESFSREIVRVILHPKGVEQPCYPGNVD